MWRAVRRVLFASCLALASLTAVQSEGQAAIIVIDPDAFTVGTDIRTAYDGVTLSVVGTDGTLTNRAVLVGSGQDSFLGRNVATTGSLIFAQPIDLSLPIQTGQHWDEDTFGLLRVDFDLPTDFVQIDLIYDDDDISLFRAFDADDKLLAEVVTSGDGRTPDAIDTASIVRSLPDISYVLAGGVRAEAMFLDNLRFNQVPIPEPSAMALFVLGLTGIFLLQGLVSAKQN